MRDAAPGGGYIISTAHNIQGDTPVDNILALKIVLNGALQGGAARSLRMDNLGKNVAAQLLRMEIEAPANLPRLLG